MVSFFYTTLVSFTFSFRKNFPAFLLPKRKAEEKKKGRPARKATNSDSLTKTSQDADAKREVFLRSLRLEFIALYHTKAEKFRIIKDLSDKVFRQSCW